MLKIGDSASSTKTFTDSDVRTFAEISGDKNPIHLDEEYAARTRFGRRLVHGILTSGMISALLGMQLPGPGSIYIKQTLNFQAPVYIGDTITATVTVAKIRADKPIITLDTVCKNQDGTVVIDGEAVLLATAQIVEVGG
ncbi:MAG: MaoC family dehydratase [Chloroflexi bacterium]|nr:MaoC family dehydratase [Chloroflexota bacterium]